MPKTFISRWTTSHWTKRFTPGPGADDSFDTLGGAQDRCWVVPDCKGITFTGGRFELRSGEPAVSPIDETSWIKPVIPCMGKTQIGVYIND